MKYSIPALMGTALSVCGVGAKLKMNIMDRLELGSLSEFTLMGLGSVLLIQ